MANEFIRTELLLGKKTMYTLSSKYVAIFGVGGVGSYSVEAIARVGISNIDIFDNDTICFSNINRQIIATHKTIDKYKVEAAKERILDINSNAHVGAYKQFIDAATIHEIDFSKYDYIIDAIDTVTSKLLLIQKAKQYNIPIISCMGTGNKLHPELLEITDISKTSVCPLAKVMRKELKVRGIKNVKVLYSKELPLKPQDIENETRKEVNAGEIRVTKRQTPGSISFVPSVAGLMIAGQVIRELSKIQ